MSDPKYTINLNQVLHIYLHSSLISLIFCIGIIAIYFSSTVFYSFSFALMCCIAISESISCLSHTFSAGLLTILKKEEFKLYARHSVLCGFQRYLYSGADLATILFLFLLTYSIYERVRYNKDTIENKKKLTITLGFVIPFVFSTIMTIIYYFSKESWDYLDDLNFFHIRPQCTLEGRGGIVLILIYYGILSILNILIMVYICKFGIFLKREVNNSWDDFGAISESAKKVNKFVYLNVFYWIFSLIERIIEKTMRGRSKISEILIRLRLLFMETFILFCGIRGVLFFKIFFDNTKVEKRVQDLIEKYILLHPQLAKLLSPDPKSQKMFEEIKAIQGEEEEKEENKSNVPMIEEKITIDNESSYEIF